ncbi:TPM domain-containing protein [Bacteroidota bacterium]
MKKIASYILSTLLIIFFSTTCIQSQDLPVPSSPTGWVNDYANVFNKNEIQNLSRKLNEYQYNNSTQIFVITIDHNNGYSASMLAPMIGEQWGVGQKGKDNGLILLMDMEDRIVFISTGYGLEEYIPDAIAKRIVENELKPAFKQGDFYGGVDAATNVMISLLDGKFTPDEYREQSSSGAGSSIGVIIFMIIMFFSFFGSRRRSVGAGGRRSNLPFWLALGMLSGSRSSGSFGNFSSGSGSFGGGFGGFTGGGGGSFGGGGAGGGW